MSHQATIQINVIGAEQATNAFKNIGDASTQMGQKISQSSQQASLSQKQLMLTSASLISNGIQLGDIMDRMVNGQLDVGKGTMLLVANLLQLAAQMSIINTAYGVNIGLQVSKIAGSIREAAATWIATAADKAHAIALAIKNALSGPVGWAILAGAAVAAAVGIGLASQIPKAASGAVFSKPTIAWVGEGGETEIVSPVSLLRRTVKETQFDLLGNYQRYVNNNSASNQIVSVNINNPNFKNRQDIDYMANQIRRGIE